jgi:HSP20 family protein
MSHVQIQRDADGARTLPVFRELDERMHAVRELAFDLFARRGGTAGRELEDWVAAERQVLGWPAAELTERNGAYEVEVTLPGFAAKDVEITATPTEVIVHAAATRQRDGNDATIIWSELEQSEVYRRFDLPTAVKAGDITATLDNGILRVVAPKADLAPTAEPQAEADAKAPAVPIDESAAAPTA